MLECHACFRRFMRAICPDLHINSAVNRFRPSQSIQSSKSHNAPVQARQASSLSLHRRDGRYGKDDNIIVRAAKDHAVGTHTLPDELARKARRHSKLELPWLTGDRMKLVHRTRTLLSAGKDREALTLVQLVSKAQPCTIAWNAIIDYLCEHERMNDAFKTYNDMKKRGQFADSYTYTALFKGLASSPKTGATIQRALTLYNSLSNPNSRVKPTILLTNAALNVCAKHNDMEAMWNMIPSIPEKGPESADAVTYTTILNAMRFNVDSYAGLEIGSEEAEKARAAIDATVLQARQIWGEIAKQWASARIVLDEDIVCSMGRLLLSGIRPQDWDDVLSLVEQTMDIPRMAPRLELRDRSYDPTKLNAIPPPFGQSDRTVAADIDPEGGSEFLAIQKHNGGPHQTTHWVQPTNNTLSLLMETCQKMFLVKSAHQYWKALTKSGGHAIQPDSPSFHAYLRLLRQARASGEALALVRDEMKDYSKMGKTYRIAMSACSRNSLSQNVMKEAGELVDIMITRMRHPDLKTCIMWMKLALESPYPTDTLVAVGGLPPQIVQMWPIIKGGAPEQKESLLALSKLMVSGLDRVLRDQLIRPDQLEDYKKRQATWTSAVQRLSNPGKDMKEEMSAEELMLLQRKKKIERFAKKDDRDKQRQKRASVYGVRHHARTTGLGDGLPVLEQDAM